MKIREVLEYIFKTNNKQEIIDELKNLNSPMDTPDTGYIYSEFDNNLRKASENANYTRTENIKTVDNKIHYGFMNSEVFEIISVKQNGNNVKYTSNGTFIELDKDGEYEIQYRTYPSAYRLDLDYEYGDGANKLVFDAMLETAVNYARELSALQEVINGNKQ